MYWLRLIRWNNLLIILLTQLLAWWCVIVPIVPDTSCYIAHPVSDFPYRPILLGPVNFLLLCLSTMLIAAAGYIINDYFDIRIDTINKPDKVILEKQIPRRLAIIVHSLMNAIALLFAAIVAWHSGHLELIALQIFCTFSLWKYSTTWKRQFMIGNVIVSLMTALSVIVLVWYEPITRQLSIRGPLIFFSFDHEIVNPAWVLYFLSFFAFILTWMREIVKDMEDYKGDAEEGCVTMPIKWGLQKSTAFIRVLGIICLVAVLLAVACSYVVTHFLSIYLLLIFFTIFCWLIFIGRKATKEHYHKASTYLKLIMVMGIGTLIIYRYFL